MKRRTSKSASEPPKTSSPSGTSGPTDATGKNGERPRQTGKFDEVVARIEGMDTVQFRQALITAGIATAEGELSEKYKRHKKPKQA